MGKKPKQVKLDPYEGIDWLRLVRLYYEQTLSVDMLPYTPEIDRIVSTYNSYTGTPIDHVTCYRALIRLRKSKKLPPRQGRAIQTTKRIFGPPISKVPVQEELET